MPKVMKAKRGAKTMKAKKAVKRVSVIAKGKFARAIISYAGTKSRIQSGLKDLFMDKRGKIVSKKSSTAGKGAFAIIKGWVVAKEFYGAERGAFSPSPKKVTRVLARRCGAFPQLA